MNVCICVTESLSCTAEIITTLYINCTSTNFKKVKKTRFEKRQIFVASLLIESIIGYIHLYFLLNLCVYKFLFSLPYKHHLFLKFFILFRISYILLLDLSHTWI